MANTTNPLPSPVKYREDINGLRAWAVMAVLLFHFSLIGLSGGFAGVDLFFVISRYLMTAIIVTGDEKGSFSIWKFYMSRVRRIVPALLVVIAVLQCGVKILNPLPYLCDDKYCYGSKNGIPLYFDDNHLSEYGNKLLVPMFEEIFKEDRK